MNPPPHVTQTTTITLYGPISLGELQNQLLAIDWPKDSRVSIKTYDGGQRDGSSTTITITAPNRKPLP